jgi:ATP-dependent Clp protease ATP-binding subunit ClpA
MLRQAIRPEFLNRVDEIIVFRPLSQRDIRHVVTLQLKRVEALLGKKGIVIDVTEEAKDWLAKLGYDPTFGARPLKRVIQKHIVNALSERLLMGDFGGGDTVEIGLDHRGLIEFTKKVPTEAAS